MPALDFLETYASDRIQQRRDEAAHDALVAAARRAPARPGHAPTRSPLRPLAARTPELLPDGAAVSDGAAVPAAASAWFRAARRHLAGAVRQLALRLDPTLAAAFECARAAQPRLAPLRSSPHADHLPGRSQPWNCS